MKVTRNAATISGMGLVLGIGAGILAYTRLREISRRHETGRWHTVIVNVPQAELAGQGKLPDPLVELDQMVEVNHRPAPRNTGTELSVRLRHPDGETAVEDLHRMLKALREAKAQLEQTSELEPGKTIALRNRSVFSMPFSSGRRHEDWQ